MLTACGGGSGGSATYTAGGTVSGLTASGLVLQNNGGDDLAVAGVSFEFATPLADGGAYEVTVLSQPTGLSCTVANGSGTLSGANITDVALSCKSWGSAQAIESSSGGALGADVAADGDGNALAVWRQDDGSQSSIYANRYVVGSGWVGAGLIETNNNGSAYSPRIAFDGAGNALAVWQQSDGSRNNIWANRYTAGSGWGSAGLIENVNTGSAFGPRIAIDGSGNAIAVWYQSNGTHYSIWGNRYAAGSGWGTATLIENDDSGDAYDPRIAVDGAGNALAVWRHHDSARYNIMANRYVAGIGWGNPELIETDNSGGALSADIAIDSNGNALAVWMQDDGTLNGTTHYNVWSNRYVAGSGWSGAEQIESENSADATYPRIAMDDSGDALAVWSQWDGSTQSLWARRYVAGTGWGSTARIDGNDSSDAYSPQLAFDAEGNALVVWFQNTGSSFNIVANRYLAGTGWGDAELIETDDAGDAADPQIAIGGDGNATAVWHQHDGAVNNIQANRFE